MPPPEATTSSRQRARLAAALGMGAVLASIATYAVLRLGLTRSGGVLFAVLFCALVCVIALDGETRRWPA